MPVRAIPLWYYTFTMRKVVITGIGAITPLSTNFRDSWLLIRKGTSGIKKISKFDASALPWKVAGEIENFLPEPFLSMKEIIRLDLFVQYAVAAASMAAREAGLLEADKGLGETSEGLRAGGVIIGSSRGGITTIEGAFKKARFSPYMMPATTVGMAASYVAQKLGCRGPCLGISNACASGANAVGEAFRLIKMGYCDLVVTGGTEVPICRLCVEGYGISGSLSRIDDPSASRPFDGTRDGFVIAEGACVLILEEYETAIRRNAYIYGEIAGYGNTVDAFHITKPHPRGEIAAMRTALKEAGVSPEEVDYVNAHGTSTQIGDKTEAEAIQNVFRDHEQIPVTSLKSMTGHMLAASGAFEVACTAMSIQEGCIPPTINLKEKDPDCRINVVKEPKVGHLQVALSNSFGFGGVNAVIVIRKEPTRKET